LVGSLALATRRGRLVPSAVSTQGSVAATQPPRPSRGAMDRDDVRTFLAAARQGSMRAAERALGLIRSTIARGRPRSRPLLAGRGTDADAWITSTDEQAHYAPARWVQRQVEETGRPVVLARLVVDLCRLLRDDRGGDSCPTSCYGCPNTSSPESVGCFKNPIGAGYICP
jgi:LmbE family N-acetylglucosaminyl deacetylase